MDKSLGTNLHLWRFFTRAKQTVTREFIYTCSAPPPPPTMLETCTRYFSRVSTLYCSRIEGAISKRRGCINSRNSNRTLYINTQRKNIQLSTRSVRSLLVVFVSRDFPMIPLQYWGEGGKQRVLKRITVLFLKFRFKNAEN